MRSTNKQTGATNELAICRERINSWISHNKSALLSIAPPLGGYLNQTTPK